MKTLVYIVSIPKCDEDGEYLEFHYFKNSMNATYFAMENNIESFTSLLFDEKLAETLSEDI